MSLETLLKAARFVEQQELRAQQFQQQQQQITRTPPIQIVTVAHTQITQTQPATLVAVPQVPSLVHSGHPLVAAASLQPNHGVAPPRPPGAFHQVQNSQVMVSTQPAVVEVIQKPLQAQQISFDKTATLLIEEHPQSLGGDLKKRPHPHGTSPNAAAATGMMRSGTREVHNKLEKNRRAHLKECFELLKKQLPQQQDEKKTSNLNILHSALRYIQGLRKKERENEHEMERLARDKIASQQRLAALKKELGPQWDNIDLLAPEPPLLTITTTSNTIIAPPPNPIKEELYEADEPIVTSTATLQPAQLSILPQVGYPVSQGLVLGVQKVALVSSKNLPLVSSPITHLIPQLNGKVVPLVNAQYLMKPVVVVSTPNQGSANITPRPS